jgi:lipopolysaccharide export system protein LptA
LDAVRKMTISISIFFIFCVSVVLVSDNLDYLKQTFGVNKPLGVTKEVSQEFIGAVFFSVDQRNQPMEVNSIKVIINNTDGKIFLEKPFGSIWSSRENVTYKGDRGEVIPLKDQINLFGSVKLEKPDLKITGDEMMIFQAREKAFLKESVKTRVRTKKGNHVKIESRDAFFDGKDGIVRYEKSIRGKISFNNKSFSSPMLIQSEKLDYHINSGKMLLNENVKIDRENVRLKAQRGSIFLNNESKKVSYFELNDDVRFSETFIASNGISVLRTGLSQKLEGFGFDRKLVFSGFPKIKQLDDLIQGNKIVIREANELVEIINTNSKFKFNK